MAARKNQPPRGMKRWVNWFHLALWVVHLVLITRWLVELARWWQRRRKPQPRPAVEAPPVAPPPVAPPPEVAAPPAVEPALPFPEAELVFEVAVPVAVAPAAPDIYLPLPPDLAVDSGEPAVGPGGAPLGNRFNWQNPLLRDKIYLYRNLKLLDFLLYFTEIDLVKDFKARGIADPAIQAKIEGSKAAMAAKRIEVLNRFNLELAKKKVQDTTFGQVHGATPKSDRFRQTYYVNAKVDRLEDKLDDLQNRRAALLKRIAWWPGDLARQAEINRQVDELDKTQIAPLQAQVDDWKAFQALFQEVAELPGEEVTIQDVLRWELNEKKAAWEKIGQDQQFADQLHHDQYVQDQLLKEIISWINREPDRFPEWVIYMVIHFSGMRYMSAHGSYADPRILLETFEREDLDDEVHAMPAANLVQACRAAIQRLLARPAANDPKQKPLIDRLVERLNLPDRNALLEVCTSESVERVQALADDAACLQALAQYRTQRAASASPMPDWVWAEICKFTPLRLQTTDPNWDAVSPERSKYQNNYWRTILASWEQKDITAWRQKHHDSLDLVVTRSVCNELAEQIQDLRGLTPYAGLTARPGWYTREQAKDPARVYLKQAPAESDFRPGASILWLEWVDNQPNAWQVAHPIKGYSIVPNDPQAAVPIGPKKEVSKKALARQREDGKGWDYILQNNAYSRQRPLPTREVLKKQGLSDKQIADVLAERKTTGTTEQQYLRWSHEATVVDVVDLIDGRYVMTFETQPKIGLNLRSLSGLAGNPEVFAGYVPDADLTPEMDQKLVNMLRWDRILPGAGLPARQRPKKAPALAANPLTPAGPAAPAAVVPTRAVVVVHDEQGKSKGNIKAYKIKDRDNQNRLKMEQALPWILIPHGSQVFVSRENNKDAVNGVFNGNDGPYLKVVKCPDNVLAEGFYIQKTQTADAQPGRWVELRPGEEKGICGQFTAMDKSGKPDIQLIESEDRILIPPKMKLYVSSNHKEGFKDTGDGTIIGSGDIEYLVVLDYREAPESDEMDSQNPQAANLKKYHGDPTGFYIYKKLFVPTTPPPDEDDE